MIFPEELSKLKPGVKKIPDFVKPGIFE